MNKKIYYSIYLINITRLYKVRQYFCGFSSKMSDTACCYITNVSKKNTLTHRNSLFRRYTVKHFKIGSHNILQFSNKNLAKCAINYKIQTTEHYRNDLFICVCVCVCVFLCILYFRAVIRTIMLVSLSCLMLAYM